MAENQSLSVTDMIASELKLTSNQVFQTLKLSVEEGGTVPFIARYRKEKTGNLDEVQIRDIIDRYTYLVDLEERRQKYLSIVREKAQTDPVLAAKFTEIEKKFFAAKTKVELEDLYLPFKPKRTSKAQQARDAGYEPLKERLIAGGKDASLSTETIFQSFLRSWDPTKPIPTFVDAMANATAILCEEVSENADFRYNCREIFEDSAILVAEAREEKSSAEETSKDDNAKATKAASKSDSRAIKKMAPGKKRHENHYEAYHNYKEPWKKAAPHRIMAVRRGELEKMLRVSFQFDDARMETYFDTFLSVAYPGTVSTSIRDWIRSCIKSAFYKSVSLSLETDLRLRLKEKAEAEAIKVFAKNLESLLMLPPIPEAVVMGIDPGIRTGSKLAIVSQTGKLLCHQIIKPNTEVIDAPVNADLKPRIIEIIRAFGVTAIAVGNGTGSREIFKMFRSWLHENKDDKELSNVKILFVNESGASVYSTDEIAREEFPDLDPTIRSAISIARRLQDPLAELVKIDPRSIGVGQYQHDINVNTLKKSLGDVVESCVNRVGVDLNTASAPLLSYVSGIGPGLAKKIVDYRDKAGRFKARTEILSINGVGDKAFQLASGFLRIKQAEHPLDQSAVHPEHYPIVERICKDLSIQIEDLIGNEDKVNQISIENYISDDVGLFTLRDIFAELKKPGRDPREGGSHLQYDDNIRDFDELNEGMVLEGTVTNVTNFGAFVDIGVHQDGLVHVSELSNEFVSDPSQVVQVGQRLKVRIIQLDKERKRISLSARTVAPKVAPTPLRQDRGAQRSPSPQMHGRSDRGASSGRNRAQPQRSHAPQPNYTLDDLLKKFNG